jgi:hypothetical protein
VLLVNVLAAMEFPILAVVATRASGRELGGDGTVVIGA